MSLRAQSQRHAVIMAGGRGTRLSPYTAVLPKPLMPVAGHPILELMLHQLRRHGFRRITICVGYLAKLISTFFGNGSSLGLEIEYSIEDQPLGTIGPLRQLTELTELTEHFLVVNGDVLTTLDFSALYEHHAAGSSLLTISSCRQHIDIPLGQITFNGNSELTSFEEKPRLSYWGCLGIYAMSPGVLEFVPPDVPFGLDELASALLAAGEPPSVFPFKGSWFDVARPEDCVRATEFVELHRDRLLPDPSYVNDRSTAV